MPALGTDATRAHTYYNNHYGVLDAHFSRLFPAARGVMVNIFRRRNATVTRIGFACNSSKFHENFDFVNINKKLASTQMRLETIKHVSIPFMKYVLQFNPYLYVYKNYFNVLMFSFKFEHLNF